MSLQLSKMPHRRSAESPRWAGAKGIGKGHKRSVRRIAKLSFQASLVILPEVICPFKP